MRYPGWDPEIRTLGKNRGNENTCQLIILYEYWFMNYDTCTNNVIC